MTVVAVDDTDSRTEGMCTTYLAARLAERLDGVERSVLVRLSPAVPHKTRGNAAVAVHTATPPEAARAAAVELVERFALVEDASPGVVVASDPGVPASVEQFARDAVQRPCAPERALQLLADTGLDAVGWGDGRRVRGGERVPDDETELVGRGRLGALAAVGAWAAFDEWTYERIDYRAFDRCGTPREVDERSVFAAAADAYPAAWDTVDRVAGEPVCVPNAPGPILYGVRGDDPEAVATVADRIDAESVERSALFLTNQGTDAHLQPGVIGHLDGDRAYRVTGVVREPPATRAGGHVFFGVASGETTLECVAFEPTKRFRDRVRRLRLGDRVTVCGEYDGTLKLEKFAVRELNRSREVVPECGCERSMESAGRGQGYRCRDCGATAPGKETVRVDRELEVGWYEVPPRARRHVARPLVRGGFDAPTHPEW
ncbi:MAG: putative DNA-binding protein containing a Zn-ribbon domain protein [halophilic archaeon J07HB67]|nr:MAG: putative DNA-binding protein containing a Zn-ribbon domain protein [halophilic archaeon J07HB67]